MNNNSILRILDEIKTDPKKSILFKTDVIDLYGTIYEKTIFGFIVNYDNIKNEFDIFYIHDNQNDAEIIITKFFREELKIYNFKILHDLGYDKYKASMYIQWRKYRHTLCIMLSEQIIFRCGLGIPFSVSLDIRIPVTSGDSMWWIIDTSSLRHMIRKIKTVSSFQKKLSHLLSSFFQNDEQEKHFQSRYRRMSEAIPAKNLKDAIYLLSLIRDNVDILKELSTSAEISKTKLNSDWYNDIPWKSSLIISNGTIFLLLECLGIFVEPKNKREICKVMQFFLLRTDNKYKNKILEKMI